MLPLILASASPRRRDLLAQAGIAHEVIACNLREPTSVPAGLPPRAWAMALAYFKARHVAQAYPGRWVLGADTIVICGAQILGKPADEVDARRMLELQAGVWTDVVTGVALVLVADPVGAASRADGSASAQSFFSSECVGVTRDRSETDRPPRDRFKNGPTVRRCIIAAVTRVFMRDDREIREAYIAGRDWEGKAGAYGIQNIGDQLVEKIDGSFSNVVGLPIERVVELLSSIGV